MRCFRLLLATVALALVVGCSDLGDDPAPTGPTGPPPTTVSYGTDVQPLFTNNCTGCHGVGGNAGLDLRAEVSYGNLVGVPSAESTLARVEPDLPDESWLYLKITGRQTVGTEMPPGGSLGAASLEVVRTWIAEGAHDN